MKGNNKVIDCLNELLTDELSAINQYLVQSEMLENWGYKHLHESIKKQAIEEMKHAESIISRIIFLEGIPRVGKLNEINIGQNVEDIIKYDLISELHAIALYNEKIQMLAGLSDAGTDGLLRKILLDEEKHLDWLESQNSQLKQMGLEIFLSEQV